MNREVILVEVINSSDLSTEKCKTFSNTDKAEKYFRELVRDFGITNEDDIDGCLDDGFCDTFDSNGDDVCVMIKEITFQDD